MPGAITEVWRDGMADTSITWEGSSHTHQTDDFLITGTHKGGTSTTISDRGKDFKSCGVYAGLAVKNTTDSTTGTVSSAVFSVTEDTVVTDITFHVGDVYKIYKTATYNSKIATIYLDRRAGRKVTDPSQTVDGILVEDEDLDEHTKNVFGPGQPIRRG